MYYNWKNWKKARKSPKKWIDVRYASWVIDKQDIISIDLETIDSYDEESTWKFILSDPKACLKVITWNNTVIGFILYRVGDFDIYLLKIAIRKNFRRKGFGSKLFKSIVNSCRCKEGKIEEIRCIVSELNLPCQLFLRSVGFFATKPIKNYYGKEEDGYEMRYITEKGEVCETRTT